MEQVRYAWKKTDWKTVAAELFSRIYSTEGVRVASALYGDTVRRNTPVHKGDK